jgi:uncharacterized membrane protein YqjE
MSDTGTTEEPSASRDDEVDGSLFADVRALLEDGQTLVEAELAYQSARVAYAWNRAKGVVLLLILALFFAFFTLVALVVGLLLALIPLLTAWGAMAAVSLALALLAGGCFLAAVARFRKARARLLDDGGAA